MGGSRNIAIGLGALGVIAAFALLVFMKPFATPAIAQGTTGATFVGVATCGGTTCHGRSEGDGAVVRQDELMLWQDPATPAGVAWQPRHSGAVDAWPMPSRCAITWLRGSRKIA